MLLLVTGVVAISARATYEYMYRNYLSTGSVEIGIEQFQKNIQGKRIQAQPQTIMPGETVSYIPEVVNKRAECYVRVHIALQSNAYNPIKMDASDYVTNVGQDWIQIGNYFYYTRVLKNGEKVDVFQGLHIPEIWVDEEIKNCGFTISAKADAIQADNFSPDFSSLLPWGTVTIEQHKKYDPINYCSSVSKDEVSNQMTFSHSSGFESRTNDLFGNFSFFMAGNHYKDSLKIKNAASEAIRLYFKTQNVGSSLSEKTQLKIYIKDKVIYESNLTSSALNDEWQEIAVINPNKTKNLQFELYLPEDSNQDYTVLKDSVIWEFKAEEDDSVATGENNNLVVYLIVSITALAMISLVINSRRRSEKCEE